MQCEPVPGSKAGAAPPPSPLHPLLMAPLTQPS
jgi:hypothetical protein